MVSDQRLKASLTPATAASQFAGDRRGFATSQPIPLEGPAKRTEAYEAFTADSGEDIEALGHDPFGWIILIEFPGLSSLQCTDVLFLQKGKAVVEWLLGPTIRTASIRTTRGGKGVRAGRGGHPPTHTRAGRGSGIACHGLRIDPEDAWR